LRNAAFIGALVGSIVFALTVCARGDEAERCASASEHAQQLRRRAQLRAARDELLICARPICPKIVITDCEKWLSEVDEALPTVIIAARDSSGHDLTEVKVLIDGNERLTRLDGKPLTIDPGPHSLRYELSGAPPVEDRIVVSEAEKNRVLQVKFTTSTSSPAPPSASRPRSPAQKPEPEPESQSRAPAYVVGTIGIVSLGVFGYFAVRGESAYRDCKSSGTCSKKDVDAIETKRNIAWVSLGVGTVALGVATYLLITTGSEKTRVGVIPLRDGALAGMGGAF
jgi:hypothetical protein